MPADGSRRRAGQRQRHGQQRGQRRRHQIDRAPAPDRPARRTNARQQPDRSPPALGRADRARARRARPAADSASRPCAMAVPSNPSAAMPASASRPRRGGHRRQEHQQHQLADPRRRRSAGRPAAPPAATPRRSRGGHHHATAASSSPNSRPIASSKGLRVITLATLSAQATTGSATSRAWDWRFRRTGLGLGIDPGMAWWALRFRNQMLCLMVFIMQPLNPSATGPNRPAFSTDPAHGQTHQFRRSRLPGGPLASAIGDGWSLLIVRDAFDGLRRRFGEFQRTWAWPRTSSATACALTAHGILEPRRPRTAAPTRNTHRKTRPVPRDRGPAAMGRTTTVPGSALGTDRPQARPAGAPAGDPRAGRPPPGANDTVVRKGGAGLKPPAAAARRTRRPLQRRRPLPVASDVGA